MRIIEREKTMEDPVLHFETSNGKPACVRQKSVISITSGASGENVIYLTTGQTLFVTEETGKCLIAQI